jgi:short-subunit dehydrogenase
MQVVITGASRGIGAAVARIFNEKGNTLFLCGRKEDTLQNKKKELQSANPGCIVHARTADLSRKEQAQLWGEWVLSLGGTPDVLINNAGTFIMGNISDEADGALESMIETNLYSAYHLTRAFLPAMKKKKQGHIFNICSIASLNAYDNGGAYSISKFALYGFSKNLRKELMPYGIKVTHVIPGAVYTESWKESGISPDRMMEPGDIAQMIRSAASLSPQACVEEIVMRPQKGDI